MRPGTLLNDRYKIDAQLGEGGMGIVYKAHDILLDRPVAIKTLTPVLLGDEGLKRLLREAQSVAKLTHPNIVAIHDVIDEGTTRLIVMEYIEGQTLRDVIPVPWRKAVEIVAQVCIALEYAHGRGVVHRDIKPENIVIAADGTAKVMDFGLARSEGRSRLTQTGMLVGTVAYMAPEQALQGTADARSDLYSLGCVLYELVTGHPPFEADDPIAVITQHINIPPVAPRFHAPDIPLALDAIILKLLAKDPHARFRSAESLGAALEQLRGSTVTGPAQAQDSLAGAELVQAIRRGILVGRDQELHALRTLLDEAASGEGRLALISGQAGIGKTRFVEELITYAHLRGPRVLSARCYEGGTPFEPVIRVLREYLRLASADEVRAALGDYASDLVRLVPEIRQKIGTLPESIPLPPDQEKARLFESVTRLFLELAHSTPILLFMDDLHLGDPATLQLLRYLAPAVATGRVLLVTAYRSEEADRSTPFAELLKQLRRERHATLIELKPLTQDQIGELIRAMAKHPTTPAKFAARVYEVTEGNPYFVEELINALFEQSTLYIKDGKWSTDFDEGGRYAEMPVPATVRTTIEARLERLGEPCLQVLTQAAVLGRQFRLDVLARLTEKTEDELVDLLEEAVRARLLREVRVGGEDRFEFVQSMVREVIYEGIIRHRRRRIHLRAAEALEQVAGIGRNDHAGEIADHFLEAGEDERAISPLIAGGEHAEAFFAHDEAIRRFETARELLDDAGRRDDAVQLLERLGEPYLHSGRTQKAIDCYQQVLAHYDSQGLRSKVADVRRKLGHVYQLTWDFASAIPILEQALEESGDSSGRDALLLYLDLARAYNFSGKRDRGLELAQRALEEANTRGMVAEAALATSEIGLALEGAMQIERAESHYREAIKLAQNSRTFVGKFALRRSINNLGVLESLRGDFRAELGYRTQALKIAEEVGTPLWVAFQLDGIASVLLELGEWESARTHCKRVTALGDRAGLSAPVASIYLKVLDEDWDAVLEGARARLSEAQKRDDAQGVFTNSTKMTEAALMLERYLDAERYARIGVESTYPGPTWTWSHLSILLAESLVRQSRLDEATRICDEAAHTARALGGTGVFGEIHFIRGLIAAGSGRSEEAIQHFREGIRLYDEFPRPYDQARIYEHLGAIYAERDAGEASAAYDRALEIYTRLGAAQSAKRVHGIVERLKASHT